MNPLYRTIWYVWKFIFVQTVRVHSINPDRLNRPGGYVLAVTHVSHLEVIAVGLMTRREIRWLARKEFYRHWPIACFLRVMGCLKVNRQGTPVSAIRAAIASTRRGEVIGIFPEGGVVRGEQLAIRGGPLKRGMSSIAIHAGVPIIPAVVLGTEKLNCVAPWLPFRRAQLWIALGDPVAAPADTRSTRRAREELTRRVGEGFRTMYGELQQRFGVRDCDVP